MKLQASVWLVTTRWRINRGRALERQQQTSPAQLQCTQLGPTVIENNNDHYIRSV